MNELVYFIWIYMDMQYESVKYVPEPQCVPEPFFPRKKHCPAVAEIQVNWNLILKFEINKIGEKQPNNNSFTEGVVSFICVNTLKTISDRNIEHHALIVRTCAAQPDRGFEKSGNVKISYRNNRLSVCILNTTEDTEPGRERL